MLGSHSSKQFMLFEETIKVPKFAMYGMMNERQGMSSTKPKSNVTFEVKDRAAKVALWVKEGFNVNVDAPPGNDMELKLVSLRKAGQPLYIVCSSGLNGMDLSFHTEDMELAGELVQDFCAYMKMEEVTSKADFDEELTHFQDILQRVEEYNSVRMRLTAEMADRSQTVKTLVVKVLTNSNESSPHSYDSLCTLNSES